MRCIIEVATCKRKPWHHPKNSDKGRLVSKALIPLGKSHTERPDEVVSSACKEIKYKGAPVESKEVFRLPESDSLWEYVTSQMLNI